MTFLPGVVELPRILGLLRAATVRGRKPDDRRNPTEYLLGRGHVRFFYPRLGYLAKRQEELIHEMLRRGYSPNFTNPTRLLIGIPIEWHEDWTPSDAALALNRAQIAERFQTAP